MKLRIIAAVLLPVFLALAILSANILQTELGQIQDRNRSHLNQAAELQSQADQLRKALDTMRPEQALENQEQADALRRQAEELAAGMETLRIEIEELKTYLEENQGAAEDSLAELTYLQGVYDELEKGLAQVEVYLAGN